jgi:phospholipase C
MAKNRHRIAASIALAGFALFGSACGGSNNSGTAPTHTATPPSTATATRTAPPTATATATTTATATHTRPPTATATPTASSTVTATASASASPTATESPTPTATLDRRKAEARRACAFGEGALPADTLDPDVPRGDAIPLQHLVIVMQENRSFDHYFGRLPAAGHADVEGLPPGASNPDAEGNPVSAFHTTRYCISDVEHGWNGSHQEWDDGRNDGFVVANDPGGERAMGYMDESDLPFYYGLAKTFAIGDHMFCALLGPTYPNRFYFLTGTSDGRLDNQLVMFPRPSIFDRLTDAGVSWKIYASDVAFAFLLGKGGLPVADFYTDAAAGRLPQVSYVDPAFLFEENDEHPPSNPQRGQQFVANLYEALRASPNWPSSALIITYDEHGGFYDHVPPPAACVPDDVPPATSPGDVQAAFDRDGFRVPLIVASPFSRPGYVSHEVYDLTSVLRFVETRFNLPALTARDANATPITDLFDFTQPHLLEPPALPDAVIDPTQDALCQQLMSQ